MGEIGSRPVGVVRFDKLSRIAVEVSIYLDPELHGLGLGHALLAAGEAAVSDWVGPDLEFIEATVLRHNNSSRRLFERAGYTSCGAERWRKVFTGIRGVIGK
jgi:RimJ/RimL family protein N-acetyltransferase